MQSESLGSVSLFFCQLQGGDHDAAREVFHRFFPRLMGLARRIFAGKRLPADADDAVQDAFWNFLQRVERGEYEQGLNRDDLWRMLSTLTVQTASKLRAREATLKRGGGRVVLEADLASSDGPQPLDRLFGAISTAQCDAICAELIEQLDPELRQIALLRLAGYQNTEIRDLIGCSLRSVERRLHWIRAIWAEQERSE